MTPPAAGLRPGILLQYQFFLRGINANVRRFLWSQALASIGRGIIELLLNLYLLEVGFTERDIGSLVALGATVLAVSAVPLGVLTDRYSRKWAILAGSGLVAAGVGVMVLARAPGTLFLGAGITALGDSLLVVSIPAFIAENVGRRDRTYAFSLGSIIYLGFWIAGALVGGYLPRFGGGTPEAFRAALLVGIAFFVFSAVARIRLTDTPDPEPRPRRGWLLWRRAGEPAASTSGGYPGAIAHPVEVFHFSATNLLIGIGAGLFVPFFNVIFAQRYGLGSASIGWLFSLQSAIMLVGVFVAPFLSERRGLVRTIGWAQAGSIAFLVLMAVSPTVGWFTASFLFRGMLMFMVQPLHDGLRQAVLSRTERATATSFFSTAWHIGWAVGARTGGAMLAAGDYVMPFLWASVIYAVATVWFTTAFRPVEEALVRSDAGGE